MVQYKIILLLSALVAVSAISRGGSTSLSDNDESNAVRQSRSRRLMKSKKAPIELIDTPKEEKDDKNKDKNNDDKDNGGDDEGSDNGQVSPLEESPCIPFNSEMRGLAAMSLTDDECRDNSCSGGCCRVYSWLICDEKNEMPMLPCVCNENTLPVETPAEENSQSDSAEKTGEDPQEDTQEDTQDTQDDAQGGIAQNPNEEPGAIQTTLPPGSQTRPSFGGAPADSCEEGSNHHNNPFFQGFTKCFNAEDCPMATECCIHSYCFCGEPDDWTSDCVAAEEEEGR